MGEVFMQTLAKKTIELDLKAIQRAKAIFKVHTDKEAVNRALQLVSEEDEIIKTHKSLAGKAKLKNLFS